MTILSISVSNSQGPEFEYLLCITDHIKRLISNGYPNNVCFNKGIPIKLRYHNILYKIP